MSPLQPCSTLEPRMPYVPLLMIGAVVLGVVPVVN